MFHRKLTANVYLQINLNKYKYINKYVNMTLLHLFILFISCHICDNVDNFNIKNHYHSHNTKKINYEFNNTVINMS